MFCPQPNLKVSKRTIATENLDQDGEEKAGEMNELYDSTPDTPYGPENKKEYPNEVDRNDKIGENPEKHFYRKFMEDLCPWN
jgi:hypothetical protein